ncbi:unnamed protein product [Cuscuta epithymum]|uniref:F-box associated beta-propeller type 3 domain-containing protein n=1 Tax=Cuscuta epithymum TaxID=186058 RepID=A0AAV0DE05_9ASTE|nr:unnamed protein product [Cuscuta epithymum]
MKKKRATMAAMVEGNLANIEILPEDLLFKILVRLPAHDICHAAMLLIGTRQDLVFISMCQGRIEVSEFSKNPKCMIGASCNGLVLGFVDGTEFPPHVVNPATKRLFILPQFFGGTVKRFESGIAYAAASKQYKVALTYGRKFAILTLGVDHSWRHVPTRNLSASAEKPSSVHVLTTEGFVHWAPSPPHGRQVMTLDVETEIVTETPFPLPQEKETKMFYFSAGKYLSLLIARDELVWDVWEMKPKDGEWTERLMIDMNALKFPHNCNLHGIYPVGWIEYPDVVVFGTPGPNCIAYNIRTNETDSIELCFPPSGSRFVAYKSSLVSSRGC